MSCLRPASLALLLLFTAACGSSDEATGDPATTEYASELGVDLGAMERRSSGLYVQDLKVGEGVPAEVGNYPAVTYSLWLADGTLVESNEGDAPFEGFQLGRHEVIQGWEEGLIGMRVGGERRLVIPAELGYGARGSGPIPGNAVLIFKVTLHSMR
jgi:FKBP-type peptidyl-prolyl cis-trans isomerase FkpA